ncbi:hypothetical protein QFZ20_001035 [Flavobacterium sp. W4I14]|nr:hypothetical protein [Flavobacterium sp. W4I14]
MDKLQRLGLAHKKKAHLRTRAFFLKAKTNYLALFFLSVTSALIS